MLGNTLSDHRIMWQTFLFTSGCIDLCTFNRHKKCYLTTKRKRIEVSLHFHVPVLFCVNSEINLSDDTNVFFIIYRLQYFSIFSF